MFVVAYLYNTNGMASWCWEASHALAETGQSVLLVCSPSVSLPSSSKVEVLRFDEFSFESINQNYISKFKTEFSRLSGKSSGFVGRLHKYLQSRGFNPTAYLLNQSNLQDPSVDIPQHVVAWSYPTSLIGYFRKIGNLTENKSPLEVLRTAFDTIGWWRRDWRAYRSSTSVLSISQTLHSNLLQRGVNTHIVYPGINQSSTAPVLNWDGEQVPKLLIAAVNLEESRKRVRWMIEALKKANYPENTFSLTLVGAASSNFQQWVCENGFPATFRGYLPRDKLQQVMVAHDIFLFGSCLDDWGYVLVEAMSQGLCVIAPHVYPFTEIVEDDDSLYLLDSQSDFSQKLGQLLGSQLYEKKQTSWKRASTLCSRSVFGHRLNTVLKIPP
jgi:glycosyltransferase involved in cell wall biosynthesis